MRDTSTYTKKKKQDTQEKKQDRHVKEALYTFYPKTFQMNHQFTTLPTHNKTSTLKKKQTPSNRKDTKRQTTNDSCRGIDGAAKLGARLASDTAEESGGGGADLHGQRPQEKNYEW